MVRQQNLSCTTLTLAIQMCVVNLYKEINVYIKKCGLSRQVVFGNRLNYIENGLSAWNIWSLRTGGLSRKDSLYTNLD